MPFGMGILGNHWRGSHAPDEILELVRDGNGDVFIREKTSGETVIAMRRTAANTYSLYNNTVAGGKLLLDSTMNFSRISANNYAGDNTANRAIPHGLGSGITPKAVFFSDGTQGHAFIITPTKIHYLDAGGPSIKTVTIWDDTNFYVGEATSYVISQNSNLYTYYWVALA